MKCRTTVFARTFKNNYRKLFCALLAAILATGFLSGCNSSKTEADKKDELVFETGNVHNLICKEKDFDDIKDDWFSFDGSVSLKAQKAHQSHLIQGEEYYFITSFNLDVSDEFDYLDVGMFIHYSVKFVINDWEAYREGDEAVSLSSTVTYGETGKDFEGFISQIPKDSSQEDGTPVDLYYFPVGYDGQLRFRTYVAIPFIPLADGALRVEIDIDDYSDCISTPYIFRDYVNASVSGNQEGVEEQRVATISKLQGHIELEEIYTGNYETQPGGFIVLPEETSGLSCLVVEFDVYTEASFEGSIGLAVRRKKSYLGEAKNFTVESANTYKTSVTENETHILADLLYTVPQKDSKHVIAVFSFPGKKEHWHDSMPFEIYLYGENLLVRGETYKLVEE